MEDPSSIFLPLVLVSGFPTSIFLAVAWLFILAFVGFCVCLCVGEGVLSHPALGENEDSEGLERETLS